MNSPRRRHTAKRVVHSAREVEGIRRVAGVAAAVRDQLATELRPGMSTLELDERAGALIAEAGGASAFLNYRGFPRQVCISIDDVVVHGIGAATQVIRPGQLVSMDVGVRIDGFVGDTATTVCVGGNPEEAKHRLMEVTRRSLQAGIQAAQCGNTVRDISRAVEQVVEAAHMGVVREFVGHGVGCELHEPPEVPNFTDRGPTVRLVAGMVLAIEPMVNLGGPNVRVEQDGWTVRTTDGSPSAHFEHMVLITHNGPEVLTWPRTASE